MIISPSRGLPVWQLVEVSLSALGNLLIKHIELGTEGGKVRVVGIVRVGWWFLLIVICFPLISGFIQ